MFGNVTAPEELHVTEIYGLGSSQEITVEHTVTSQKHYSFILENAAEMAVRIP